MIPEREECLRMIRFEDTPETIISHILQVERIAVFLARILRDAGEEVDIGLVQAASLLHDLKKWAEIEGKVESHGEAAFQELKTRFPEVARVVRMHMLYAILDPGLSSWEEKLVHYADRRVNHDAIVSLDERFEYLNKRYPPKDQKRREEVYRLNKELEHEIFSFIPFPPDRLQEELEAQEQGMGRG